MSHYHWIVQGVGIDTSKVKPYIDGEKFANVLYDYSDYNKKLYDGVKDTDFGRKDGSADYLLRPACEFDNLAELLTFCDDTNSIVYTYDGKGNSFFHYPPSMPWERTETEPQTIKEVHNRIIEAVKKITSLTDDEIDKMIDDDLYVCI